MSEEQQQSGQQGRQRQQSQQSDQQQGQPSPLQTERGNTTIQEAVVTKVAAIAAQEIEGVRMGGGGSQAVSGILGSITGGGSNQAQTTGVSVEVGEQESVVDLIMTTEYGRSIPQLTEAVRRNVVNRIENLVGLRVNEVNIVVANVFFPQEEQSQQQLEGQGA